MRPTASIIIVTYNSADQIGACLAALTQLDSTPSYEIIIVDNASTDDTITRIRSVYPGIRIIAETENHGFAGGVNRGVAAASGDVIALLNPDAVPHRDWLQQLSAALADSRIGVTGSKVLATDGRLQSVGLHFDADLILPASRGEGESDAGQYDAPADVWSVHGAAMAFRRQLWDELGGFDEGFFPAYWEESDFCERARRGGYRVVIAPMAVITHAEATSTGKYSATFYYYFLRNRLRYAAKWYEWPALWHAFRPAEHARLHTAPLLDRRVARLVYESGVPSLESPDQTQRAAILAMGRTLRDGTLPADGLDSLLALLAEAEANSVHDETQFRSRLPFIGQFRATWNNVATRWYVRPNFDQQTRYNLALQRATLQMIDHMSAQTACAALDVALLASAERLRT